jgi:hypothetical protein
MKLISGLTMLISRKDPNMLKQNSLKPIIDVAITQIFCDMHELLPRCHLCRWLSQLILKILALVIDVVVPLVLNNHIVHDHTSSHHISHPLWAPSSSRVPNNSPP